MGVVFWFLVIAAAFVIWYAVSPLFPGIGAFIKREAHGVKQGLSCDNEQEREEN